MITGHTGFKGTWLTLWLFILGAKVTGISNSFYTKPSHFKSLKLKKKIKHLSLDISKIDKQINTLLGPAVLSAPMRRQLA